MEIDFRYTKGLYTKEEKDKALTDILEAKKVLDSKSGEGNDYLGWLSLPSDYNKDEFENILNTAEKIKKESQVLLVLGIGGSYLGAKSAIELLRPYYDDNNIEIYFVGNSMSSSYIYEVYNRIQNKDFSINIISKSGSTTETSVSTRLFLDLLTKKYKDKAYERVYATTDLDKGILHDLCVLKNIPMFQIRDDIGGRYSVLTAVGLLPMAVAGIDIKKVMDGALCAMNECKNLDSNSLKYATLRYMMYKKGYKIEILSAFEPKVRGFIEWYKQLFAESEGKGHKGMFPTGAIFTTDLHSIGQMIQDGERNIIETIIKISKPMYEINVPGMEGNLDKLDFLKGMKISEINNKALIATALAHYEGGVPTSIIEIDELNEFNYGYMVYFFMYACGLSAYAIGVNPFNQPGVESYKKNMFALLGKPGYEELAKEINNMLEDN